MRSVLQTSRANRLYLFVALSSVNHFPRCSVPEKKITLEIQLQPGAKRNEIAGFREGVLYVKVNAVPEKGRANQALLGLLSETLGLPRSAFAIIRGQTSRNKVVSVRGLTAQGLQDMLARELPCKDFLHLAKG
jgi:uncharacterized protein (TIGR00251 family)